MRKIVNTVFAVAVLSLASFGNASAQTLEDAEARGRALFAACTTEDLEEPLQQPLPEVSECCAVEDIEPALQEYSAYVAELVAAGVISEAEAFALFQELRDFARESGCGDVIDALFEELFPDTAFIGTAPGAGGLVEGTPGDGDGSGSVIGTDGSPSV